MDLFVDNPFSPTAEDPGLFQFVEPFSGRIKSLELMLRMTTDLEYTNETHAYLLAESLKASGGKLKRLGMTATSSDFIDRNPRHEQYFVDSSSSPPDDHSLQLDLPHEQLEEILRPISDISLDGLYFKWTSKAYHGLTSLKLRSGYIATPSIPESQLLNILGSSPQLRWLEVHLDVSQTTVSPNCIRLAYLQMLIFSIGATPMLRLIQPGSGELTATISDGGRLPPITFNAILSDFFSRANVTKFFGNHLLKLSDALDLLSIAPCIRVLLLSRMKPSNSIGVVPDSRGSLKELILRMCDMDFMVLRGIVELYNIEKLVLWGSSITSSTSQGRDRWDSQELVEKLSDMGNIVIESHRGGGGRDIPLLERFLGPIF